MKIIRQVEVSFWEDEKNCVTQISIEVATHSDLANAITRHPATSKLTEFPEMVDFSWFVVQYQSRSL